MQTTDYSIARLNCPGSKSYDCSIIFLSSKHFLLSLSLILSLFLALVLFFFFCILFFLIFIIYIYYLYLSVHRPFLIHATKFVYLVRDWTR